MVPLSINIYPAGNQPSAFNYTSSPLKCVLCWQNVGRLLIQGYWTEESQSQLVDNGQNVGRILSGLILDIMLIYFSLVEEQTSQLLGGWYNVGRLLSGGNVDKMLIRDYLAENINSQLNDYLALSWGEWGNYGGFNHPCGNFLSSVHSINSVSGVSWWSGVVF